jgi:hypothetical protein
MVVSSLARDSLNQSESQNLIATACMMLTGVACCISTASAIRT